MNNILVTGGKGQLGSELRDLAPNHPNYNFFFTDRSQLDITNHAAVDAFITKNEIDTLINCAAYTAVDKAESEPDLANAINHLAVRQYSAEVAKAQAESSWCTYQPTMCLMGPIINGLTCRDGCTPNPHSEYTGKPN